MMRIRAGRFVVMAIMLALAACTSSPGSTDTALDDGSGSTAPATSSSVEDQPLALADQSRGGIGITLTQPSDWSGETDSWAMETGPSGFDRPDGAGIIAFVVDEKFYVYRDPCKWSSTRPGTPATTVDELVAALSNQRLRDPSAPENVSVDGFSGKKIMLTVPNEAVWRDCDRHHFATLGVAGEDPALWAQGRGEIDEVWIFDVDGRMALLEAGYYAGTPQFRVDEVHAILDSMRFEPAR